MDTDALSEDWKRNASVCVRVPCIFAVGVLVTLGRKPWNRRQYTLEVTILPFAGNSAAC